VRGKLQGTEKISVSRREAQKEKTSPHTGHEDNHRIQARGSRVLFLETEAQPKKGEEHQTGRASMQPGLAFNAEH